MCGQNWAILNLNWLLGPGPVHLGGPAGPRCKDRRQAALSCDLRRARTALAVVIGHPSHSPAYGTAWDMPLPLPHPRQPALADTAGAEWAVCCCVRVVTTAFDHASTTDGTDVLGIVGSVVFGCGAVMNGRHGGQLPAGRRECKREGRIHHLLDNSPSGLRGVGRHHSTDR